MVISVEIVRIHWQINNTILTVVIVDGNQVTQLQMTGKRTGLRGNTLLETAITKETVGVVVNQREVLLVEDGTHVGLGNGKTDSVGNTYGEVCLSAADMVS